MTKHTSSLVEEFIKTRNIWVLPSILIGMQEEDNVSEIISFRNCFKGLRNLAAHKPDMLLSKLSEQENKGCQRIVFKRGSGYKNLVLDMVQFTIWMYEMYMLTGNTLYIDFIETLMFYLYSNSIVYQRDVKKIQFRGSQTNSALVAIYLEWSKFIYQYYGITYTISIEDQYMIELLEGNPKIFWHIAIPDMLLFVLCFIRNGDVYNLYELNYLFAIYKEREGVELEETG